MKKRLIPMALIAAAMSFSACSSDEATTNGNGTSSFAEGGYVKMAINLPSTSSNRANDNFDDGLAAEYQVKDATLILFSGADEATAKFHSAYNLNVSMSMDAETQITSTTKIVSKIEGDATSSDKLYAYVVLNNNGLLSLTNATSLTVNGQDMTGKTVADLQKLEVKPTNGVSDITSKGFLMNNAPLANMTGGTTDPTNATVTTLVDFTSAVKKTQAEAENSPATDVYVERAMGKVTFEKGSSSNLSGTDVSVEGSSDNNISYEIVGWQLDVTNKSSYFAHNYSTEWNGLKTTSTSVAAPYRFISSSPVRASKDLYRTYWATDPNYNKEVTSTSNFFNYLAPEATNFSEAFGTDNPQYCFENTFDVAYQNTDQTTRAIVKVKLFDGADFYVFNGDKSRLYPQAQMENRVKNAVLTSPTIVNAWKAAAAKASRTEALTAGDVTVTYGDRNEKSGNVAVASVTVKVSENGDDALVYNTTDNLLDNNADLTAALGLQSITKYVGGIAYYPVRIKHFGDDLTPWNSSESTTDVPSAGNIYVNNNANNYLGRYGVVRNNWYDLSVASISGLGSAVVPSVDPDTNINPNPEPVSPDDELYNYIAVRINILSWAKRTQSEKL